MNERLGRLANILVSLISLFVGLINGVLVILTGTSYFNQYSLYSFVTLAIPQQLVIFLFSPYFVFILASLLGVLFGAAIGWAASHLVERSANSALVRAGAISGGIGGFLSLGIIFFNIYASWSFPRLKRFCTCRDGGFLVCLQ